MIEPAALTPPASAGFLVLPPVTDVFRDDELDVLETKVAGAEIALRDARYDDVVAIIDELTIFPAQFPNLALRALLADSWARMYRGELDEALARLKTAKQITHRPGFNDLDRAGVLCRIGAVRVKRGSISRAVNDLTLALELCNRSGRPCDRLRAEIYDWRSRFYQRQRDFNAARADIEAALELCDSIGDRAAAAGFLKLAVSTLFDAAGEVETGYAVSSLAQVYLRTGKPELAEKQARTAIELLGDREDVREEIGNVQLVLGRALMELGEDAEADESFAAAETSFADRESASLLAAAWMARGELALDRDDSVSAAQLYRQAAEALSDFHF